MKTFEYFISYNFKDEAGNTGFGSGVFYLDEDLDELNVQEISEYIKNNSTADVKFTVVVPLFYHKRKIIEE